MITMYIASKVQQTSDYTIQFMLKPKIIDCHTHAYPDEVTSNPLEWANKHGEHHWAELVAPEGRKSIQGWSDPAQMLATMDSANVDEAILLGWYWTKESTCRWHNKVMAEWISYAPDRFNGFASIYPNNNVIDQLETAKALGFIGVGELHIGVQNYQESVTHWQCMAKWCANLDWPINFHVTDTSIRLPPGAVSTSTETLIEIAKQEPRLKIILAHWGGRIAHLETNPYMREILRNVYYDSAASPLIYDMSIFKQILEIVGPDKILFGSDYPLKIYPRFQKVPEMNRFINSIYNESGLSSKQIHGIMGENFNKLLPLRRTQKKEI